jgi:outer membrane protein assembly factor BamB
MTRPSAAFVGSLALVLAAATTANADDWLYFRGANHDGKSAEKDWQSTFPEAGPKIAWKTDVGVGASSMVVAGNRMITMGNRNDKDVVSCLDVESGKPLWTFEYACPFERRSFEGGTAATPTIDGDFVYTFSHVGDLHCLTLAEGKVVWKKQVVNEFDGQTARWKYAGSPLVMGDLVYVDIGGPRSTIALSKKSGAPIWATGTQNAGYASPVAYKRGDKQGLMVFKGSELVAYDANEGTEWWRIAWSPRSGVNASSPVLMGDKVFISSGYGMGGAMYDIAGAKPRELWRNADLQTKTSQCIEHEGFIYAISERGQLYCIDGATGKAAWSERGFGQGTLAFAAGKLIILSAKGELVIADASSKGFSAHSRAQIIAGGDTCWVNPVLANGRIYCRSNRGQLVCVDVRR